MLQNPCKTLGFKKNMVYKIPPGGGGEVNHIQPVAIKSNLEFRYQIIVSSLKFRNGFVKFLKIKRLV